MVYGFSPFGYEGVLVSVEVDMTNSIPGLDIVGLASNEVKEARERVRIAIKSSGFHWPTKRILVNLAPADVKKRGSGFDLSIALAILESTKQIDLQTHHVLALGELQFNGKVRPVRHTLSAGSCATDYGIMSFIVPSENLEEISVIPNTKFCEVFSLGDLRKGIRYHTRDSFIAENADRVFGGAKEEKVYGVNAISLGDGGSNDAGLGDAESGDEKQSGSLHQRKSYTHIQKIDRHKLTLADLSYCDELKRVAQVAAAGRHNIYLSGAPGTGKTAIATRISSLLPHLNFEESLEVSKIYSCNNSHTKEMIRNNSQRERGGILIEQRPTRMPHHTASMEGMVGSATKLVPGEISLAHTGVLILDEAPEFKMQVLQALREPMDNQMVHISRADHKWSCPADFQLVLTSNLCPCGNLGKGERSGQWCLCSEMEIFKYWKRIGGALWDRIDIKFQTKISSVEVEEPYSGRKKKADVMFAQVQVAVEIQRQRWKKSGVRWNSRYSMTDMADIFLLAEEAKREIVRLVKLSNLSERGKLILSRISRTIADLEQSEKILSAHVGEAYVLSNSLSLANRHNVIDSMNGEFAVGAVVETSEIDETEVQVRDF